MFKRVFMIMGLLFSVTSAIDVQVDPNDHIGFEEYVFSEHCYHIHLGTSLLQRYSYYNIGSNMFVLLVFLVGIHIQSKSVHASVAQTCLLPKKALVLWCTGDVQGSAHAIRRTRHMALAAAMVSRPRGVSSHPPSTLAHSCAAQYSVYISSFS